MAFNDYNDAAYDEFRAWITRNKRTAPVAGNQKGYKYGAYELRVQNTGSDIKVILVKGGKTQVIGLETYKGASATANNFERAYDRALTSAWRKLQEAITNLSR